jgi:hypothetical protein
MISPESQEAGCSFLTVHGRQRDRALHHAPARWEVSNFMGISWDFMVIYIVGFYWILWDLIGFDGILSWEYHGIYCRIS